MLSLQGFPRGDSMLLVTAIFKNYPTGCWSASSHMTTLDGPTIRRDEVAQCALRI